MATRNLPAADEAASQEPQVETDVPFPEKKTGTTKWKLHTLDSVGASISWPKEFANTIQSCITRLHKNGTRRYITAQDPKNPTRMRIWRAEDHQPDEVQAP